MPLAVSHQPEFVKVVFRLYHIHCSAINIADIVSKKLNIVYRLLHYDDNETGNCSSCNRKIAKDQ